MKFKTVAILYVLFCQFLFAQFGQNKVQYSNFDWLFIRSPHFDVYYYGNNFEIAKYTADQAEIAYEQVSKHLRWTTAKPITIIVYNSHNDFQQTNVTWEYMVEGIGGVTELFKNRVVIPFEGSYAQFRHVIHHELVHAIVNDMIYGGNVQSIVSGKVKLRLPLWTSEGLAEFLSSNWDTKADMILRDLALNEDIPDVKYLDAYMAYKGGQSVWRFIADKYGRETIGEILIGMKKTQNAEKGFKKAIHLDFEGLTKKWHQYLKKEYWPDISDREELGDIAKQLTDHEKLKNYYNIAPSISPDGSRIAILSDRSGYADIYLIDAATGKPLERVIKGNRSIDFEELKWLQPGVSWSPDGENIVVAAKSGNKDALQAVNVQSGKKKKYSFPLNGIFSPVWSPNGDKIAFVGHGDTSSDIYVYELDTQSLTNITDDFYSDSEPSWSPDGTKIVYSSNHDMISEIDSIQTAFQSDIFVADVQTKSIEQITNTDYNESYPVWANTEPVLFYTADQHGVWNVYKHHFSSNESFAITNVLTGVQQISLSENDDQLVFAGFKNSGWDIYSVSLPLELKPQTVPKTQYILSKQENEFVSDLRKDQKRTSGVVSAFQDYSTYIFAPEYEGFNHNVSISTDSTQTQDDSLRFSDEYVPHAYKTRFTLDIVNVSMGINTIEGAQGMTYFTWSDILGDHHITLGTQMVMTLDNSDLYLSYAYLKNRVDWYGSGYHRTETMAYYNYSNQLILYRFRNYGLSLYVSRPFNRYHRLEGSLSYNVQSAQMFLQHSEDNVESFPKYQISSFAPSISWVYDNSVFGYTGPVDGFRQKLSLFASPAIGKNYQFNLLSWDVRKYYRFSKYYTISGRVFLGKSTGSEPVKFLLGGLPNWLFGRGETNGKKDDEAYKDLSEYGASSQSMLENIYFVDYVMPLRGARYGERIGTNVALTNLELRFPLLFALGTPSAVKATYLFGHFFVDSGTAWGEWDNLKDPNFAPVTGAGFGVKLFTPFGLLRIDTAWDVYGNGKYSRPQYYFSFGADW